MPDEITSIKNDLIEGIKNWFFNYVEGFKRGDEKFLENILLKEEHTIRVCDEIKRIGEQLELTADNMRLAEIMALLHDVGRFEQYAQYHTFLDLVSEDHAKLGVKILKKYAVLAPLDKNTRDLILRTISYHNRASLPQKETESCLFFTKLLRDADKLDIWKVVTDYYHQRGDNQNGAIMLGLPDTPGISSGVYHDLLNKRTVEVNHIRNLNDFKLLQAGWIFDINFKPTMQTIKNRHYLEMIREVLPHSDKIKHIFALIHQHLDDQLRQ